VHNSADQQDGTRATSGWNTTRGDYCRPLVPGQIVTSVAAEMAICAGPRRFGSPHAPGVPSRCRDFGAESSGPGSCASRSPISRHDQDHGSSSGGVNNHCRWETGVGHMQIGSRGSSVCEAIRPVQRSQFSMLYRDYSSRLRERGSGGRSPASTSPSGSARVPVPACAPSPCTPASRCCRTPSSRRRS
jgi:hypothetical protein